LEALSRAPLSESALHGATRTANTSPASATQVISQRGSTCVRRSREPFTISPNTCSSCLTSEHPRWEGRCPSCGTPALLPGCSAPMSPPGFKRRANLPVSRLAHLLTNLPANLSTEREPSRGLPDGFADPCASTSIAPARHGKGSVIPPCRLRFMSGFEGVKQVFFPYPQSARSPQDIASAKEPSTSS
jgi:hypothetical protein